jgi:Zn-dependent M16 (insulinase) family peptidase
MSIEANRGILIKKELDELNDCKESLILRKKRYAISENKFNILVAEDPAKKVMTRYQKKKVEELTEKQSAFNQVPSPVISKTIEHLEKSQAVPDNKFNSVSQGNTTQTIPFIPYMFNRPIMQSTQNTLYNPYQLPSLPFCAYLIQPLFMPFPQRNIAMLSDNVTQQISPLNPECKTSFQVAPPHN